MNDAVLDRIVAEVSGNEQVPSTVKSEDRPRHNVAKILEARALDIDRLAWSPLGEWTPLSVIDRQISHVLDQIERIREAHALVRRSLLRQECYVDTELMHLDVRSGRSTSYLVQKDHYQIIERDRLKDRLFRIELERRDLALKEERELRGVHDRLLELLGKHWQLSG